MPQACRQCGTVAGTIAGSLCPACLLRLATLPASRVPDYEIETLLGSGTGTTYLARAADGSLLAVKQMGTPAHDDGALEDLAGALHAIDHPHLARTIGIHLDGDGIVSMIRGYVPGRGFDTWLASIEAGAREAARQALGDAIARLHDAGLAHGHITASNVVIGAGSRAILLDAGAAAVAAILNGDAFDVDAARAGDIVRLRTLFGDSPAA